MLAWEWKYLSSASRTLVRNGEGYCTVQIFSGKPGGQNAGFQFQKRDWRGLSSDDTFTKNVNHAIYIQLQILEDSRSFPQGHEALHANSQSKMCSNFRTSSRGPTSMSLEPEYSNNISYHG